jgi:hypothetical protein
MGPRAPRDPPHLAISSLRSIDGQTGRIWKQCIREGLTMFQLESEGDSRILQTLLLAQNNLRSSALQIIKANIFRSSSSLWLLREAHLLAG